MSRSAADATRFTATGPYAHSKPGAAPYKLPGFMAGAQSQPTGPSGGRPETPKEKVERLRAQARAARLAQSTSRVDTMIDVGRRFANKAHKAMVYTLIAASGICGALTVYSMVSLTLYNRRQRALWIEKELQTLQDAKTAYASGTATSEQLELLKNEKIGEIYQQKKEEEKAQRPWNKLKRYLFDGLSAEEAAAKSEAVAAENNKPRVLEALEEANNAKVAAAAVVPQPGQLDALAENAETAAKETTRSWKSWLTGR
ncbi:cytochrome oxidase c assembly-domain-containing protein [Aspergillus alliaceus]|uniref:Cytochrome oxidase c assembly-domain-containing protein n=1 Tax=Petromyces alliaceus TaxID=209559 RepID=A0A5N6GDQ2_PETAA|nr:cytochrome oxidase c assembly-domain-containing protein [Aspergillus alliaceus]KAB8238613.1 cytochrome oxidase c assembly-domain-containing protein [Aspergillus alliaceus]KAE8389695.1 cytochrome oxidase c assembly-domain-containing protein [Aspergillus alliaceus]